MHAETSGTVEQLNARVERLEAELEVLTSQMARGVGETPASRRRVLPRLAGVVMAIGLLAAAVPAIVLASHRFTDVLTSSTFHADIDAIAQVGVTVGCAPGLYCPKEFVTREQMAAFLNRLGALAPGKTPVVNATKLDGLDSTAFLPASGKAADSDLLDGLNSTAFLAASGKAADSNLLDGLDSTAFLPANGTAVDAALLDGLDSTAFARVFASGSTAINFGALASLACTAQTIGGVTTEHVSQVLVSNPYDEASGATGTTLHVTGYRVPNGAGDQIYVKVCNLGLLTDPANATFRWTLFN